MAGKEPDNKKLEAAMDDVDKIVKDLEKQTSAVAKAQAQAQKDPGKAEALADALKTLTELAKSIEATQKQIAAAVKS